MVDTKGQESSEINSLKESILTIYDKFNNSTLKKPYALLKTRSDILGTVRYFANKFKTLCNN